MASAYACLLLAIAVFRAEANDVSGYGPHLVAERLLKRPLSKAPLRSSWIFSGVSGSPSSRLRRLLSGCGVVGSYLNRKLKLSPVWAILLQYK